MVQKIRLYLRKKLEIDNPIIKKLSNGMAWTVLGTVCSKMFVVLASIITARLLGVDQNGEYGIINSTILMFSTFAGLGLGTTATRFVAEYKETNKEKCGRIIGMTNIIGLFSGIIMAIILVVLAPWLAREQLNAPHLASGLVLASIMLITNTVNIIQINVLSGFENFKGNAKLSVIQGLISFPIFIYLTFLLGVNGLILGQIMVGCIMVLLYGIENHKVRNSYSVTMDIKNWSKELDIMVRFSIPSMLSNIMIGPIIWIGNTFITSTLNGYYELGIFNAANQWRTILVYLPSVVGSVILPLIVANKGNNRLERINILFGWMIVICFSIPILAAPELIAWMYGRQYSGHSMNITLLLIVLICCILAFMEGITRNLINKNLMWWGFLSNSVWGMLFLIIVWSLREWGSLGIAAAYFLAYIVTTVVFVPFYVKRGVVAKSLLLSKEVIFMWLALIVQLIGTSFTTNIGIRSIAFVLSLIALWRVGKFMTNSKMETSNQ